MLGRNLGPALLDGLCIVAVSLWNSCWDFQKDTDKTSDPIPKSEDVDVKSADEEKKRAIRKQLELLREQEALLAKVIASYRQSQLPEFNADMDIAGATTHLSNLSLKALTDIDRLIAAIKGKDEALACAYISKLTPDELNQGDSNNATPLYCALKHSRPITLLIIDKFLNSDIPLNYKKPDGTSILVDDTYGKYLLAAVNFHFKNFACLDVLNFSGNIHPDADRDEISSRMPLDESAAAESAQIQPFKNNFSRKAISHCAMLVEKAKAGACTQLALAAADRLLKLFPNERIQIYSHNGGRRGSHVYVVVNHHGKEWALNHIQTASQAEVDEYCDTFIVDPWLATLGWKYSGVSHILEYIKSHTAFAVNCECFFDSKKDLYTASVSQSLKCK